MTREWNEPHNNQMQADERGNGKAVPRSLLMRVLRPRLNVITSDFSAEVRLISQQPGVFSTLSEANRMTEPSRVSGSRFGALFLIFGEYQVFGTEFVFGGGFQG